MVLQVKNKTGIFCCCSHLAISYRYLPWVVFTLTRGSSFIFPFSPSPEDSVLHSLCIPSPFPVPLPFSVSYTCFIFVSRLPFVQVELVSMEAKIKAMEEEADAEVNTGSLSEMSHKDLEDLATKTTGELEVAKAQKDFAKCIDLQVWIQFFIYCPFGWSVFSPLILLCSFLRFCLRHPFFAGKRISPWVVSSYYFCSHSSQRLRQVY